MTARSKEEHGHDIWFRSKVAQALCEADDPTTPRVPHDFVTANWHERCADFLELAKAQMDAPTSRGMTTEFKSYGVGER